MTKRDLVVRISDETGMVQQQVQDIVQRTLDIIAESLAKGAKVELRNFGVFDVKVRKARIVGPLDSEATRRAAWAWSTQKKREARASTERR